MTDPHKAPLCYLATVYSKHAGGIDAAFAEAARLAARLMLSGVKIYSPIAHGHPLAVHGNLDPLDHALWLPFDEAMLDACGVLIVANMDGWQDSKGIAHEIMFFARRNKPIFDLDVATMTMTRRKSVLERHRYDGASPDDLESDRRGFLQNNPPARPKPLQRGEGPPAERGEP